MSSLDWYGDGDVVLTYFNSNEGLERVLGARRFMIQARSPALGQAIERSRSGFHLHLDALTSLTAEPFLQYLLTEQYSLAASVEELSEDVPTSLLIHCQLYRLGDIYDMSSLRSLAYLNIIRQCEFGCSSPHKPVDLCAAIEYVYAEMPQSSNIIDTIVSYCVSCYFRHNLRGDTEFRRISHNFHPFQRDLCKNGMGRGPDEFDNAQAMYQLPFAARKGTDVAPMTSDNDMVYHFHGEDEFADVPKRKEQPSVAKVWPHLPPLPTFVGAGLPLREKRESISQFSADHGIADLSVRMKRTAATTTLPQVFRDDFPPQAKQRKIALSGELSPLPCEKGASDTREGLDPVKHENFKSEAGDDGYALQENLRRTPTLSIKHQYASQIADASMKRSSSSSATSDADYDFITGPESSRNIPLDGDFDFEAVFDDFGWIVVA